MAPPRSTRRLRTATILAVNLTVTLAATLAPPSSAADSPPAPPAAADSLAFASLSFEDGISHDLVYCMHEDRLGFLWFGTMHGLIRHDGVDFVSFRHDPDDPTSLANDDAVCLAEDARGDLWIGTYGGGVARYDRAGGRFVRYPATGPDDTRLSHSIVWGIDVGADGAVWIATQEGLDRLDPDTGRVTRFAHDPADSTSIASNATRAVLVDRTGDVWVGTGGEGVGRLELSTGRFTHYTAADTANGTPLDGRFVTELHEDASSRLWVGFTDGGLARYDEAADRLVNVTVRSSAPLPRSVATIESGAGGELYLGTALGLVEYVPDTDTSTFYRPNATDPFAIHGRIVQALCYDASGVLWVSCYQEGVDRAVRGEPAWTTRGADDGRVQSIAQDTHGTIWIATGAGLVARDGSDRDARTYVPDAGDPHAVSPRPQALVVSPGGELWIGSTTALQRYDRARDRFETWRHDPANDATLTSGAVTAFAWDDASLWVGTSGGLNAFDPATGASRRFVHDASDPASIPDNTVLALFRTRAGDLWVATYAGLSRLRPGETGFTHFAQDPNDAASLMNNYVYAFHEDDGGALWLGTGGGLARFDPATETFRGWRERDGLPSSVVSGILPDPSGSLWLSTHRGIARFDPETGSFTTYDRRDGLASHFFRAGAYAELADGRLAFGSMRGFVAFDPAEIERNARPPSVVLTRVQAAGTSRWADAAFADSLSLRYDEAAFTIGFAAIDSRRPEKNRHAYRLDGFDADWIDAGTARSATYTSVPPGRYVFRVRGANADGVWNDAEVALPVRIAPPFWRTAWFAALVALLVAGGAAAFHRYRVGVRVAHVQDLAKARAQERETVRQRAAADFHDELGHRITKIGLFGEMLRRQLAGTALELDSYLDKIVVEARRLASDTRDFLWTLRAGDSLHDLLEHLAEFGTELFDRTDVEFRVEGIEPSMRETPLTMEGRRHISSIFKEAMHNALRHADCTEVVLSVEIAGDELVLSLVDDGKGYARAAVRAGRGLRNMEWRALKVDGTIGIASEPGAGSRVTLKRAARPTIRP